MKLNHALYFASLVFFLSCSDVTQPQRDDETPAVEKPLTLENLSGRWADHRHSDYLGGGFVDITRSFSFSADGTISFSQVTNDSPPSGSTTTYLEFIGICSISNGTITCYPTKYRTKATAFSSDSEAWVTPPSNDPILVCPAMLFGSGLYWYPSYPVWTEVASTDPHSLLSLEAFVMDVQQQMEKLNWIFYDSRSSRYSISQKDSDGVWQETLDSPMTLTIENGKLVERDASPTDEGTKILKSENRYFFGDVGISHRY